jgi:type VI secretion system protein ImpJ
MAKRPVHWYEGMFLKPHHFQAAERFFRERVRESEDWLHPYNWGLRLVRIDADAVANYSVVLNACHARFKDGTTVSIPDEVAVDPEPLKTAFSNASETTVFLAIPTVQMNRANVQLAPAAGGPRYYVNNLETPDENTGDDKEPIQYRNVQARLLLSHHDRTGYEILPLARIVRAADAKAPPRIDPAFVPPVLGLDVWAPLHEEVRALHEQIGAWITQESDMLVGRKIAFDSQVLGDADRVLRLSFLNTAFSALQAVVPTTGLHPLGMYQELCRLLGHISIFDKRRRPIDVDPYDHENIGPIYAKVIQEIRRLLGTLSPPTFEKRYFQLEGKSFRVALEPSWILETSKIYIGVETLDLSDPECDDLIRNTDWKLGSAEEIDQIFKTAGRGLNMRPISRIPPALPTGVVYFEMDRVPHHWRDVVRTHTLALRFGLDRLMFQSKQVLRLTHPVTRRTYDIQLAVYVVKPG